MHVAQTRSRHVASRWIIGGIVAERTCIIAYQSKRRTSRSDRRTEVEEGEDPIAYKVSRIRELGYKL